MRVSCQCNVVTSRQRASTIFKWFTLRRDGAVPGDLKRDYWPIIETMVEADIGSKTELALRFGVVGLGGIFMTWASARPEITLWLATFLLTNGYYSWRLSRIKAPVSWSTYAQLKLLFMISVTLYTSCAIYVFLLGTPAYVTLAMAALIAQALFNISRHRQSNTLVFYDTVVVALTGMFFGLSSIEKANGGFAEEMVIIIATVGVCSYYVIAQIRKIQIHDALRASRQEAVQTQKMRAVGQLTAGIAHEFNNLLTVIRGNIELAQLAQGTLDSQERLADAIAAADRADALTSQLLSLSRKAHLNAETVDLTKFWQRFGGTIQRIAPATMTVRIEADPVAKTLYCDPNQLEAALIKLIVNARHALAGQGNVWLGSRLATPDECSRFGLAPAGSYVVISVRDDGPGIPAENLPKVIEPFFTTRGVGQGTGLGLPMVKGFCEQSGGGFTINSTDQGTTVLMAIPINRPAPPKKDQQNKAP